MSFEFVKEVDLVALVASELGAGESTGKWVKFDCPFCKPIRRDSKKFLLVTNGDEKRGSGFTCKYCNKGGDAVSWLKFYRNMTSMQALDYLRGPYVQKRNIRVAVEAQE
jgi:hypothetical protein